MRCDQCNKFVSFDTDSDPEVEDESITDDGQISITVRIHNDCAECGQEMKEASFSFEEVLDEEVVAAHTGEGHAFELEVSNEQREEDSKGAGRYRQTFYGCSVEWAVRCVCQQQADDAVATGEFRDTMKASHMDELI